MTRVAHVQDLASTQFHQVGQVGRAGEVSTELVEMPRMDGYEFATHVRNDARFGDVPIIMITSRVGDKHRARAIEIGVNDYLSKPYQEANLIAAIENLLGREL